MLAALIEARRNRRGLSIDELTEAAYLDREVTDMPADPPRSVRVLLVNNEDKLASLGWKILGPHTTKNGFWLVPVERE